MINGIITCICCRDILIRNFLKIGDQKVFKILKILNLKLDYWYMYSVFKTKEKYFTIIIYSTGN